VAGERTRGAPIEGTAALLAALLIAGAIYAALIWAPTERTMGFLQRIFYFHAASGWAGMLALGLAFIGNVGYLVRRKPAYDWLAVAGAEVGLAFFTIVLITGPIWAKPAWGVWWDWDARLTSTLVLWVLYVCYLLLRRLVEHPERRAVVSAVFGVFAFLDVPLVYFSIWWFRTQHPKAVIGRAGALDPHMLRAFAISCTALSLVMLLLVRRRYVLESLRYRIEELRGEWELAP
jgi:heme exporter protein C